MDKKELGLLLDSGRTDAAIESLCREAEDWQEGRMMPISSAVRNMSPPPEYDEQLDEAYRGMRALRRSYS